MLRTLLVSTSLLAAAALPAFAQSGEAQPTLSLSASADVQLAPEYATVSSGVVTRAETAQAAVRANAQAMSDVFSALRAMGVAEDDMQTSQMSVSPVYSDRREPGQIELNIIGYEARNTVSAKIRDTDRVGQAIDAMVEAGANNINSVNFGADDTGDALNEARRNAVASLLAKAELFADAAGFELCGIRRMGEDYARPPQPVMMRAAFAEDAGAATPVAAGQLTLTASVNADFCISQ
jgi:hypothetical protein